MATRITDLASAVVGELKKLPDNQERADTILDCIRVSEQYHTRVRNGFIQEFAEPDYTEALRILHRNLAWCDSQRGV